MNKSLTKKIKTWFNRERILITILFFSLMVIVLIGGIAINRYNSKKLEQGVKNELKFIASIKTDQISQWYEDELKDAKFISQKYTLIKTIDSWISSGSAFDKKILVENISSLKSEHDYHNIELLSPDYKILISVTDSIDVIESEVLECAKKAFLNKRPASTDFIRKAQTEEIYLHLVIPIYNEHDELLSFLIFIISPEDFLYPLINKWPLPSETAETLVLRKDGDSIVFLNELRHLDGTVLNLKIPLSRVDVPGIQAALGFVGIFEGFDYRDVEVLAYLDKIKGTPWFIVSKVDKDEIYSSVNKQSEISLIILILLIVLIFSISAFVFSLYKKNIYKSLYLSQEEFKTTLYSIGDGVITTDGQGLIKNINLVAEQLTGWKEKDALNKPVNEIFRIVNELTLDEVECPVQKVIENGKIIGLANHTLLISKEGKHIPIADSGAPIFNEERKIIGVVLVFRDQTAERNHNNIIEESRRQLFTLMSNLSGMAYRCRNDKYWTMEFVSKGCFGLTGYSDGVIIDNKELFYSSLIVEEDRTVVWKKVQNAIEEKTNFEIEYRIKTKNNQIKWVWEKGQGVFGDTGELIAIEGFINDINKHKNFESALIERGKLFQNLASSVTVGIFRTDSNGLTTYVNPEWCKITGLKPEEGLGNKWLDYVHPDDINLLAENWNTNIIGNKQSYAEYRFIGSNNESIWVKGQAVPEYDDNNELIGYIGTINNITETKLLLDSLTEKDKGFNAAQELAKVGSWEFDIASKSVSWSRQMFRNFNLDVSSNIPSIKTYLNLIHPDDRKIVIESVKNLANGIIPETIEYRTNPELMSFKYLISTVKVVENTKGQIVKYSGTISDITTLKESESKLENSNLLLRTIIDIIPDSLYLKDVEGKKLIANKADLVNIGADNENEVIGKSDFDLFPKAIAQEFWAIDQIVINNGQELLNVEEEVVNFKNERKWLLTSKIPYCDPEGKIIGLVGIGRDITRRKKDEEEKMKLFTILTQSPVSIIITNMEGEIEYANPKFTEVTGYALDEVIGENPRFLKSGNQPNSFYKEMWDVLLSGFEWKSEFHNKKKNGELFWENVTIAPIKNNKGVIVNYVAIKEDITSRKQLLSDLIIAKERAEDSDRLKTSFLANMSHEIRTPLNSILGFTSIITESENLETDEKEEYTSIIKKSGDSLLQIINDIIDISSLETGQLKIVISKFDPADVVRSLFSEFSNKVKANTNKQLELKLIKNDEQIQIETDRNRLNQILINLLTNSLKFTEKGYIEFGIEKTDKNFIYFKVSDTGIGIEKDLQDVIFERFRQGEDANTRHFGGNGLGLSIVRNLIDLMGGEITVESEFGKGSVFRFSLPIISVNK